MEWMDSIRVAAILSHLSNIDGLICRLLRLTSAQSRGKYFSFLFGRSWIEIPNLAVLVDAF